MLGMNGEFFGIYFVVFRILGILFFGFEEWSEYAGVRLE